MWVPALKGEQSCNASSELDLNWDCGVLGAVFAADLDGGLLHLAGGEQLKQLADRLISRQP